MTALWRTSLVVTTATVTAVLGGCQRSEASPPSITAPMQVVNHRPIVDAEVINGDGEAHAVRLLVDTRGSGVAFTTAAAKRARLELGKRQRLADGVYASVDLKAVRIGKTRLDLGAVEPLAAIDPSHDHLEGVDGLIGARILERYARVTMNFPAGQITFGDKVSNVGARVPTRFEGGIMTARVTLGADTQRLVVDTGSVTTHIRERVPIRITGTRQGVWGDVVLAPFEVVSDPEFQAARDGLLGGNLLERFTLRIDYEREVLRISTT